MNPKFEPADVRAAATPTRLVTLAGMCAALWLAGCGGSAESDSAPAAAPVAAAPASAPGTSPAPAPTPAPAPGSAPAPAPSPAPSPTPSPAPAPSPSPSPSPAPAPTSSPTTTKDAVLLAHQASFGPTEALVADIAARGPSAWIAQQMTLATSRYTSGGASDIHQYTGSGNYCDGRPSTCWRDNWSSQPLVWDFYRNAIGNPDQLRQRVGFALQKMLVVSGLDIEGTYGMRAYHNALLDNAFGNYREVLRKVTLSPVMGDYLNNTNNDKAAPNENYARELLQLFSIGTCELNTDGTLKGGTCTSTYGNETVRSYAYALTGWTYPAGGRTAYGCWPSGTNCTFYAGDMVPVPSLHDTQPRTLLSGVSLAAGHSAEVALERVLDSLMQHPNTGPFVGKQLIQQLVSSNPSPAYVGRVAAAFTAGRYQGFGTGQRGDLAATVAAVLLDAEARSAAPARTAGKLREPVLMMAGVLRALNGRSDGEALTWWWGETLRQHVFRPPSVFNFFPPDYPLPGSTTLKAPEFGIHNANSALERLNYLTYLLWWGGSQPAADVPSATGTSVTLSAFTADAADAGRLVDRFSTLATGGPLPAATRSEIVRGVEAFNAQSDPQNWQANRVRQAAFLVFGSPNYQIQR